MKIAIVGSGISGLAFAHAMKGRAELSIFEAESYFGGHTHTVDITLTGRNGGPKQFGVDTGFLVFNERTYPNLIQMLDELGVETALSDMSFSVKAEIPQTTRTLEWNGASLNTVFAQRRNLLNWRFMAMLREILRFNALATRLAVDGEESQMNQALGEFLDEHRFSPEFRDWYFLPMMACIWSCPTSTMMSFPVSTMVRFCHNHGLIQVNDRPRWWTVKGGAKHYVEKILAGIDDKRLNTPVRRIERDSQGVTIFTDGGSDRFDKVIMATHSDQTLKLLANPSLDEQRVLGAVHFQLNRAVLHTDASVLPQVRRAWAAWNYESSSSLHDKPSRVCLHYLINKLQPIPFDQPVVVSLNPLRDIASEHVLGSYDYSHPVFDHAAIQAQTEMPALQGQSNTYFCGAWMGYGFHEDGLKSGLLAAKLCLQETHSIGELVP